ncbi:uncharacterized mitochondrial protein AtMg00860-like [Chelonia mydas]|uniref:uncharacterized mitochondrial protein AtMg00860-like n=1 Tax=Chelonia mydas TaxID=8469 RepID=UPI001CA98127|nr:uncharacterized mitochondrial protein AtMg00860-like [Chelonia mydas]
MDNPTQHCYDIGFILKRIQKHGLFMQLEKCTFDQSPTEFLGYILSSDSIKMDPQKVEAIYNWAVPRSPHPELHKFLLTVHSRLLRANSLLLHKAVKFVWTPEAHHAFEQLKAAFTTTPV